MGRKDAVHKLLFNDVWHNSEYKPKELSWLKSSFCKRKMSSILLLHVNGFLLLIWNFKKKMFVENIRYFFKCDKTVCFYFLF